MTKPTTDKYDYPEINETMNEPLHERIEALRERWRLRWQADHDFAGKSLPWDQRQPECQALSIIEELKAMNKALRRSWADSIVEMGIEIARLKEENGRLKEDAATYKEERDELERYIIQWKRKV